MRACHTDNCPVGIATQKDHLRSRLIVEASAQRLTNWFEATVELMQVLARACGHDALSGFESRDLTAWKREIADLTGVRYAGN
jgi:glutamate synthase domain-containing protein 2